MRPAGPRSSAAKDGGRAETVADSGGLFDSGEGLVSFSAPRKELRRGFVRILSGTSSIIEENVSRWLIRLAAELWVRNTVWLRYLTFDSTYLAVLNFDFLYASRKAAVRRKARKDAFPRAVCEMSVMDFRIRNVMGWN